MQNCLAIFLGGGIGALLRYFAGVFVSKNMTVNFPLATFLANIVGSLIIGFVFFLFLNKSDMNETVKLALTVGFCGGLTTFSTFSLEIFSMIKNNQIFMAMGYVALSLVVCVLGVWIGAQIAKYV